MMLPQKDKEKVSPSSLGDDHLSPDFIKLGPEFPVMKDNFD